MRAAARSRLPEELALSLGTEALVLLLLVLLNGVLSMSEIAMVSARKVRLRERADAGDAGARAALDLAADPGRFLSTVQIGITLVGILAGVFGGATFARHLSDLFGSVPALAPHSDAIGVGVVVLAITYLTLVGGELVPKQVALAAPERVAALVARPLRLLSRVSSPVVSLLDLSSRAVLRLLPVRRGSEPPITEEELRHLLTQGTTAGVFEPGEQAIVERVVRLGERRIAEIATPRSAMVALDVTAEPAENWRKVAATGHVFYPVYESVPDRVLGIVSVRDLWQELAAGREPDLRQLVREPLYLPENVSPLRALERARATGRHVALVLDEHGGIEGLATLRDLLEAIVGELDPPQVGDEPMLLQRPDGSWLVDGLLPTEELFAAVGIRADADEDELDSYTAGGLVMERLGRLPRTGDRVEWRGHVFEVLDMDGRRVDKLLVSPAAPPAA